jgi:general L-amino acid transport system permease protein
MNSKNLDLPKAKIQINRNTSLIIGILFFFLGIFDFCLNNSITSSI